MKNNQKIKNNNRQFRIVMSGPLPPAIGGMATVIDDIAHSSLQERVELQLFDTLKKTKTGRPLWQGIVARFILWKNWLKVLGYGNNTVAHIHTCSGLTFFLDGTLLVLAKMKGCSVVLHIHGATFDNFLDNLPSIGLALGRWFARRADRVVVLSDEWEQKLSVRLPRAKIVVIANGVPVPLNIKKYSIPKKNIMVLFLGNLCQRKGVWELLEAMKDVPDFVNLILAGGEEDQGIGEKVKKYISENSLTTKVDWLGPVYGADKHRLLEYADVFVLPSHAEGLPISLLEAMGAGLPVVITPVGGIPSVVTDAEQGLLVAPGDSKALANAITQLAENVELREKLGNAARARCLESYGIEHVVDKYMTVYESL